MHRRHGFSPDRTDLLLAVRKNEMEVYLWLVICLWSAQLESCCIGYISTQVGIYYVNVIVMS